MRLTSLAIKTAGLNSGGGYGTPATTPTYYLRIYSISGNTATFLIAYSAANHGFTDGGWLQWSRLNVPLATNRTYAFTFGRQPSSGGWVAMAVATNQILWRRNFDRSDQWRYVATGSSHSFDAVFNLGFATGPTNPPASQPLAAAHLRLEHGKRLEATGACRVGRRRCSIPPPMLGSMPCAFPVSWNFNATTNVSGGVTNYPVNPAFVAQVKQAVDWALDAGMYAVINIHWDGGWLENNITTNVDPVINAKMQSHATQIATAFAGYDNRLLFAAANEPNVNSPEHMKR